MSQGKLTAREGALIALTVATVRHCPYCIDNYRNQCLSLGVTDEEMREAIRIGRAMSDEARATHGAAEGGPDDQLR